MGTRADLYVGRGDQAQWLGSTAYDGYPKGIEPEILRAESEAQFRAAVAARLAACDHATLPEQGWPWPWEDSRTTDYAYAWEQERSDAKGETWMSRFGRPWVPAAEPEPDLAEGPPGPAPVFPDMTKRQNVRWDRGSGVMLLRLPGDA